MSDLETCAAGIHSRSRKMLRELLHIGRYLLLARSLHARPIAERGQGKKAAGESSPAAGLDCKEGLDAWLDSQKFEFKRTSAYTYMCAAERMGLHADSTEADVDALQLEGKTLRSLTAPADDDSADDDSAVDGSRTPDREPPVSPRDAAKALWTPLIGELADAFAPESAQRRALHLLPPAALKDVKTKLLTALDVLNSILKN